MRICWGTQPEDSPKGWVYILRNATYAETLKCQPHSALTTEAHENLDCRCSQGKDLALMQLASSKTRLLEVGQFR